MSASAEPAVPISRPPTDRVAVESETAGSGRPDRFEDRFDDLAAIAYRVVFRLLGNRQDAEDLTQETLTRAYQRWRRVRGHAEPWVARVAANLALDAIRRGKRRPTVSDHGLVERAAPSGEPVLDRVDLVRVLQDLPRRQREVVVLRHLADLSEVDTARELGVSIGSVKQHGSRGLSALRQAAGADGSRAAVGSDPAVGSEPAGAGPRSSANRGARGEP